MNPQTNRFSHYILSRAGPPNSRGQVCRDDTVSKSYLNKFERLDKKLFSDLSDELNAFRSGKLNNNSKNNIDYEDLGLLLESNIFNINVGNLKNYEFPNQIFNNYLNLGHIVLDGLRESERLIKKLEATKAQNKVFRNVLKTPQSMKEYLLENFQGKTTFFGDSIAVQQKVMPTIKKEYAVYIQRFGFPEKGKFKSELISQIRKELIESGEIEP